jgi:hypothetical protein
MPPPTDRSTNRTLAANPIHSRLALVIFDTATLWMATDMVANAIRAESVNSPQLRRGYVNLRKADIHPTEILSVMLRRRMTAPSHL